MRPQGGAGMSLRRLSRVLLRPARRRGRSGQTCALLGLLPVLLAGASGEPQTQALPFERIADSGFASDHAPWFRRAFDMLTADMDLDGDPDLLINWHHHERLELFENVAGKFVHRNPRGADRSGLYDNRGVPELFATQEELLGRIEASGTPGLYVWHDQNRGSNWRFFWMGGRQGNGGLRLQLEVSLPVLETSGLTPAELDQPDDRHLRIALVEGPLPRLFGVRVRRVATQLVLRLEVPPESEHPPIFAGAGLTPQNGHRLELWKPDPHGIAWVDAEGTRNPEIYITRGGLGGELLPPANPKLDRYYLFGAKDGPLYRMAEGIVPPSYGRGRRVEWVDIEGDGTLELSIANQQTANELLVRDQASGALRDRAADWGLDLKGASVQTWGDLDGDGRQDLFFQAGTRIDVLRNRGAGEFELLRGDSLGLILPDAERSASVIDPTSLRLADFDNDGDLDLWVLGYGRDGTNHLFRFDGKRFAGVSHALGLDAARGSQVVVLLDINNDGFEDAVSFGKSAWIWTNHGGQRFELDPVPTAIGLGRIFAATACDVDGDGRTDLLAAGRQRHLLRNVVQNGNAFLDVVLRSGETEPVGAVVRAWYSDGTVRAQRYGSAHSTAFSQALGPLRFGIQRGITLEKVGVKWPGERNEQLYEVPEMNTRLKIVR